MTATLARGPDYSNWSGRVDLASVRAAGHLIVGLKASEGIGYTDPTFARDWQEAQRVGLSRIAYCFGHADYGSSPEAQADHFLAVVRAAGGWHPWDIPCLDIEAGNLRGSALAAWIDRWCRRVERVWRAGLVYSGNWYLGARAMVTAVIKRGWQLWTSAYGSRPVIFSGFPSWRLWQHSDGRFGPPPHRSGRNGNSDMNIANGTWEDWAAWTHYMVKLPKVKFGSRKIHLGNRGTDVVRLQQAINHRLHARGKRAIVADGIFGPDSERAKHYVENVLGFPHVECVKRGCSQHAQTIIDNPRKRPPAFLARAIARAAKKR